MVFAFNNFAFINKIDIAESFEDNVYLDITSIKSLNSVRIYFNRNILSLIFGYGLLNCLTNSVDSEYTFDRIVNFDSGYDGNFVEAIEKYNLSPFVKYYIKKRYNIVLRHSISIVDKRMEDGNIYINTDTKFGFIKRDTDKFRFRKLDKEYNVSIKLSAKEAFDLINFSSEDSIAPHSS